MNSIVEALMQRDILVVGIILTAVCILLLYRVVKGPHVVDRLIAVCCIQVLIGIVMILAGGYESNAIFSDLGFIVVLLAFGQCIFLSKYVEDKL